MSEEPIGYTPCPTEFECTACGATTTGPSSYEHKCGGSYFHKWKPIVRVSIPESVKRLARFRLDPSKLRISVRPEGERWLATIKSREGDIVCIQVRDAKARAAVRRALRRADELGIEGVDLGMQWAYPHPWR